MSRAWKGIKPTEWGLKRHEDLKRHMKEATVMVTTDLVFLTPVDTGRARSNWIVTNSEPSSGTVGGGFSGRSGATSIASAAANRPVEGITIYVTNNLPYILYLEHGTDKIAPYYMVRRAIARTAQRLNRKSSK